MKKTVTVQLIKTTNSVVFGASGKACEGNHYCDGPVIYEEAGEVVGEFNVCVKYDGRVYHGSDQALAKDIAAGLNGLYSSNFTDHEADIVGGNVPFEYPLSHKNKSAEFLAKRQGEWEKVLENIECNRMYA